MELHEAQTRYPDLMSYIASRNSSAAPKDWYAQLRIDEAAALQGELAAVADAMRQARADYAEAHPQNPYPYNRSMGEYLGLPIRANGEPDHGYYMAGQVEVYDALGRAKQTAAALIAEGKVLSIVVARSKKDRQPVRFARFRGPEQIKVCGDDVHLDNGKHRARLHSCWSRAACLERVVEALRSGIPLGETAERSRPARPLPEPIERPN